MSEDLEERRRKEKNANNKDDVIDAKNINEETGYEIPGVSNIRRILSGNYWDG